METAIEQRVDWLTMAGWGAVLMPLLTMWHEIGGHAAACAAQGGQVREIGAFYVECKGLTGLPEALVALAGVAVNTALALIAFQLWRRSTNRTARLVTWLVWVSEGFVASGYFCFSGVTGLGDLGIGSDGALADLPHPGLWRAAELALGITAYALIVRAGIRGLSTMVGTGAATRPARRRIAHGFYLASGAGALLVGLLNPLGLVITITSAIASSFGGLAGFISIGFAARGAEAPLPFTLPRNWAVIGGGALVLGAFAVVLGPTLRFPG